MRTCRSNLFGVNIIWKKSLMDPGALVKLAEIKRLLLKSVPAKNEQFFFLVVTLFWSVNWQQWEKRCWWWWCWWVRTLNAQIGEAFAPPTLSLPLSRTFFLSHNSSAQLSFQTLLSVPGRSGKRTQSFAFQKCWGRYRCSRQHRATKNFSWFDAHARTRTEARKRKRTRTVCSIPTVRCSWMRLNACRDITVRACTEHSAPLPHEKVKKREKGWMY